MMWVTAKNCSALIRYLRCAQRYLHHATAEPDCWGLFNSEYQERHRRSLISFTQRLCPQTNIALFTSDEAIMDDSQNTRFGIASAVTRFVGRACRNSMLRAVGHYWLAAEVIHRARNVLTQADDMLGAVEEPQISDSYAMTQSLARCRWRVGWMLCGSGCRDAGDIWPTDDGEGGKIAPSWLSPHTHTTSWQGRLSDPTTIGFRGTGICGDRVRIELSIVEDAIRVARFQAEGCIVSKATASLLCQRIEGMPVAIVSKTPFRDLLGADCSELTFNRRACASACYGALWQALEQYSNRASKE